MIAAVQTVVQNMQYNAMMRHISRSQSDTGMAANQSSEHAQSLNEGCVGALTVSLPRMVTSHDECKIRLSDAYLFYDALYRRQVV